MCARYVESLYVCNLKSSHVPFGALPSTISLFEFGALACEFPFAGGTLALAE